MEINARLKQALQRCLAWLGLGAAAARRLWRAKGGSGVQARLLPATTLAALNASLKQELAGAGPTNPGSVIQIYLADGAAPPSELIQRCLRTVQESFPTHTYTLYNNAMVEAFLRDHYPAEVLVAYRSLRPYAYKADLARLCILQVHGGWYVDASVAWATPVLLPAGTELVAVRDLQRCSRTSWACSNGLIYARAGHPSLQAAIDTILRHCSEQYYGSTPLCPTGPVVWGRAVALHAQSASSLFCELMELTPGLPQKNAAFVGPDGELWAFLKPTRGGGGLQGFAAPGTNNYNHYWHARQVYQPL
jgi:hypothetical protein